MPSQMCCAMYHTNSKFMHNNNDNVNVCHAVCGTLFKYGSVCYHFWLERLSKRGVHGVYFHIFHHLDRLVSVAMLCEDGELNVMWYREYR